MAKFSVIEFIELKQVQAVPSQWFDADCGICYWPKTYGPFLTKILQDENSYPDNDWLQYEAKLWYECFTVSEAREKAKHVSEGQETMSDEELKKTRKLRKKYPCSPSLFSDDSDDERSQSILSVKNCRSLQKQCLFNSTPKDKEGTSSQIIFANPALVKKKKKLVQNTSFGSSNPCKLLKAVPDYSLGSLQKQSLVNSTRNDIEETSSQIIFTNSGSLNKQSSTHEDVTAKTAGQIPFTNSDSSSKDSGNKEENQCLKILENHIKTTERFHEAVLRKLEWLALQITEIRNDQVSVSKEKDSLNYISELPPLPAENIKQLETLENWLESQSNLELMIKYLLSIGGTTSAIMTRRALKKLLGNDLASKMTWTGKNTKISFRTLKLQKAVMSAVMIKWTTSTELDVEKTVINWLKYSYDRMGGRDKRRKF